MSSNSKPTRYRRKPQRSLRTTLIIWFVLLSVAPLAFVTGYSVIKFEKAIDNELMQRLSGNAREISVILQDYLTGLEERKSQFIRDRKLIYNLSVSDQSSIRALGANWLRGDYSTQLTFFGRDGRLMTALAKQNDGEIKEVNLGGSAVVYLSENSMSRLKNLPELSFVEFTHNQKMSLIHISKVQGANRRTVGFVEQLVEINEGFLSRLNERLKLELVLIRPNGQVIAATHPDFYSYKREFFENHVKPDSNLFFELTVRGNPHGFIVYPLKWGNSEFFLALGASKNEAKNILRNVNYAFFAVVGAVIILLISVSFVISETILRPLNELVEATESLQFTERPVEIPIKSDTEIGLLTESFNEMSRNILRARSDLKKKIGELEAAYQELQGAQDQLVHSSKMVSLGQLVAGVAHELNNPIGFIYSNMSHLRDYSDKLLKLADAVQKNPNQIEELKKEYDIDYIRKDLPRLIASCEDGARRTRDIVLGLRNFSRLEEAKLKDIDIHSEIDNTLNLLAGEIKNRLQIHKDYNELPLVSCYGTQISQVFMNILSNAVQAIEGSGNIWIHTKQIERNNEAYVQVSFQDSGKGMTQQVMDKIFDPFFSTKGVGQGTGLGLSISYGIIENHGGDIVVKSQVGIGTEFVVTIPVKAKVVAPT